MLDSLAAKGVFRCLIMPPRPCLSHPDCCCWAFFTPAAAVKLRIPLSPSDGRAPLGVHASFRARLTQSIVRRPARDGVGRVRRRQSVGPVRSGFSGAATKLNAGSLPRRPRSTINRGTATLRRRLSFPCFHPGQPICTLRAYPNSWRRQAGSGRPPRAASTIQTPTR